jgi:D-alanyl-D-alanine carboxypeptidase
MLGVLIEEVAGRAYVDVVAEQLLVPLGIDGMRFAATFDDGPGPRVEHRSDAGRNYLEVLGAAGSWIASPTEIVTILNAVDPDTPGWKALAPATFETMRTIIVDPPPLPTDPASSDPAAVDPAATTPPTTLVPPPPPTAGYGMGLMIFGPDAFGHTGTVESTRAMTVRRPDGITWAVTVSGDYPASTRDLVGIVDRALRDGGFV